MQFFIPDSIGQMLKEQEQDLNNTIEEENMGALFAQQTRAIKRGTNAFIILTFANNLLRAGAFGALGALVINFLSKDTDIAFGNKMLATELGCFAGSHIVSTIQTKILKNIYSKYVEIAELGRRFADIMKKLQEIQNQQNQKQKQS